MYMFLKSLEIRGFKSFADKTELKFTKGITAVVGPNGSGKSNVSDAVRWVLGEQSAKTLRGSKMEDIIFTGTEYRKPIGLAQVSLTLDNSDESLPIEYNEVKVTRRIFRSGESEYLINNSPCRLKDIVTLFMDTGIGKEGYSLIGQGKIEAILSGKAEDRRALLEEAAGIVKYKSRKSDAERKLKNTNDNLTRINDIIYTYEERLVPLEEEKKKAEKYLVLANELKEKDINLLVNNLIHINNEIEKREVNIKALEKENEIEKEKQRNARENLKNLKFELEKIEKDNNDKKEIYLEKKEQISSKKAEIGLLEERIKNYTESIKKSREDIKLNKKKLEKITNEYKNAEKEFELKKQEIEDIRLKQKDVEESLRNINLDIKNKEKTREKLKNKDIEALKESSNYSNREVLLESKLSDIVEKIKNINSKLEGLRASLKVNIITIDNMERNLKIISDKRDNLLDLKNSNIANISNFKNDISLIDKEINKNISIINRLEANKEMLNKLENQYEGYNVSVKKIMSHMDKGLLDINKNDSVVLGEILSTNKGYETAVEISLGAAISNIITKDEFIAKKMISYLKENKLGRATFLPLSIIKGKKIVLEDNLKKLDGYLGIASELVEYENKYENVINYILGRTIICKDIDSALNFAKKSSYRYKLVTLAGEVVNAGGALTGGSVYQKNMGIISRKNELENIEKEIVKENEGLSTLKSKKEKLNSKLEKNILDLESIEADIRKNELESINLKNEVSRVSDEVLNIKTSLKNLDLELVNEKASNESLSLEYEKVKKKALEIRERGESNKAEVEILTKEIEELLSEKSKIEEKNTKMKISNASIKENLENKSKSILRLKSELSELEVAIKKLVSYNEDAENSIAQNKDDILSAKSFINIEEEKLVKIEEKTKDFDIYRAKLKEKLVKIEGLVEEITLSIAKKEEEIHRQEILYTKQDSEKRNSSSKLEEEYNIDVREAMNNFTEIIDIDKHKAEIYSLKTKINSLGTVNVNAVEEFRELSDKYRFITTEKSDLENAKEELENIIEEMTSKMRVIFRQNFNILNKNFDETFKELFKGGTAKLILDDSDELNGEIEIKVQPPGKKIQNINLMSGGEKVLSAIALLFSILKMKPTPFCILDEIEAALDDANVSRYADFLREFSENIQFIVITHRKGTMEVSDIMYGVTMEEKGISKIVSVDLNKK